MKAPKDIAGYDPFRDAGDCYFDEEAAQLAIDFFPRYLVHVKGRIANQPMDLNPWEREFVKTLFGWKRPDGSRRYREAFVGIPRKNNKSTLAAGLGLFLLICDREEGAEVYCAASDKDQASLVFQIAAANVRRHPSLAKMCKIKDAERRIVFRQDSLMRAIPADAAGAHGFNAHAVIMDELHTQPNRDLYDVMKTSMAARRQPLMVSITTAGHDKTTHCYEMWDHARKVRDGDVIDPHFLPVLYEAQPHENWQSPKVWKKCNPNYGRSVTIEYLQEACERAVATPLFENTFKRLHLNMWTESETRWITSEQWKTTKQKMPTLKGQSCVAGMDLASTSDVTAVVYAFQIKGKLCLLPRFWVPEEAVRQAPKRFQRQYQKWVDDGWLNATPGNATDYDFIKAQIDEDRSNFKIEEVRFDPWNALDLNTQLEKRGIKTTSVPQTCAGLTRGCKVIEEAVLDGKLVTNGNPVLDWMVACTVLHQDGNGNRKPDRKASCGPDGTKGKIDGVVAMIMAASGVGGESANPYKKRGVLAI